MSKFRISRSGMPTFALFQIFFDLAIIVFSAFLCDFFLGQKSYIPYHYLLPTVLIGYLLVAIVRDLYYVMFNVQIKDSIYLLLKVWTISFWSLAVVFYFNQVEFLFLLSWFVCAGALLTLFSLLRKGFCDRFLNPKQLNVAFVGRGQNARMLRKRLKKMPWTTFNIIGFYDNEEDVSIGGIEKTGDLSQLIKEAKAGKLDQIYVTDSIHSNESLLSLVKELADTTCSVMILPDIFTFNLLGSRLYTVNNISLISIYDTPIKGLNSVIKRIEDIVLSVIILLLISPVLVIIALAIKLTSRGPVIFKQDRYGVNGGIISVWKFRSMKVMENDSTVKQATKNDPRLTPIGGFLRRTSLDELPQFFNVLFGDMSIVGPRPHAVIHNEEYRQLITGYMQRHKVKPGITGWAQINGYRGETDTLEKMERRVKYDLEYIRNWSISLDLKIIFLTIFKGFIGKTAY